MLKSTYKAPPEPPPLLGQWSQHEAPDGRPYYYNDSTKQSTYIRPTQISHRTAKPPHGALGGALDHHHDAYVTNHSSVTDGALGGAPDHHHDAYITHTSATINGTYPQFGALDNHQYGQNNHYSGRRGGRGGYGHQEQPQPKDRPKKRYSIPGCPPWVLVQTRLGRRFVHNPNSEESFWKFPLEIMKGVVEYDRQGREKGTRKESGDTCVKEDADQAAAETEFVAAGDGDGLPTASAAPAPVTQKPTHKMVDSDGEEYEEVEVTDDEDNDHRSKRQKTDEGDVDQPVEFNEDDIAYQLATMGEDYGLDPGEYGDDEGEDLEEGAEGLALTEEDSNALFKDMLNDYQISPYSTWDQIIEAGHIIEDDRYTVLPNMRSRKDVWDEWSRGTIQRLQEQREKEEKKDPRIPYLAFLQSYATPKLYWPEFRRKYKKEPEMHNTKLSDKDREKWYREYISRLKLPESTLKADLVKLLKSTPLDALNLSTTINSLPAAVLTDVRFISLRKAIREPLIEAHISTLPAAPLDSSTGEEEAQARKDRERREQALAERQKQVQEEKERRQGALQYSKGMLLEGEAEVQRAMRVGKEGLLGHIEGE